MTIIPYNSEIDSDVFKSLYDQTGNGMVPVFSGEKFQRGFGVGSLFGRMLNAALPTITQGMKSLGKTAVRTGLKIAKDKLAGKSLKDSFSDNFNQARREVIGNTMQYVTGRANSNKKRKRLTKNVTSSLSSKRKRRRVNKRDIFTN